MFKCLGAQYDFVDSIVFYNICRSVHFATDALMHCPMQERKTHRHMVNVDSDMYTAGYITAGYNMARHNTAVSITAGYTLARLMGWARMGPPRICIYILG